MEPYATVEDADAYHENHMFSLTWDDADAIEKLSALVTASRLLRYHVPWLDTWLARRGYIAPLELKDATAEFARRLMERGDPFGGADTGGLSSLKAGPIDLKFTGASSDTAIVPVEVLAMLSLIAPTMTPFNVPIIRF